MSKGSSSCVQIKKEKFAIAFDRRSCSRFRSQQTWLHIIKILKSRWFLFIKRVNLCRMSMFQLDLYMMKKHIHHCVYIRCHFFRWQFSQDTSLYPNRFEFQVGKYRRACINNYYRKMKLDRTRLVLLMLSGWPFISIQAPAQRYWRCWGKLWPR